MGGWGVGMRKLMVCGGVGRGGKRRRKGRKTPTYTQARDKNRGQRREKKKPKTLKPRIIYKHTSAHEIIPSMHRSACVLSRLLRKTPCKIVRRGVLSCFLYKVCTLNPPPPLTWSFKPCKRPLSSARFWVFFWVSALRALILLQKVPQEKIYIYIARHRKITKTGDGTCT